MAQHCLSGHLILQYTQWDHQVGQFARGELEILKDTVRIVIFFNLTLQVKYSKPCKDVPCPFTFCHNY